MKPFTKEQLDVLDIYNEAIIDAIIAISRRPDSCNHENIKSDLNLKLLSVYALLVNDSEPVVMSPYCKADLPAYDGKPVCTYNPETHLLVPRVWSEEEKKEFYCKFHRHSGTWVASILHAITTVFGGEK